jgi:ribonuclease J
MIKIYTIGGYSEVGKNMTVIDLGEDAIIIDAGFYLPAIVEMEEADREMSEKKLRSIGALPNDLILDKLGLRGKVRAILASHAHLDHIGAIPYIEHRYNAEIISTPYSIEVLKTIYRDENISPKNVIKSVQPNSKYTIYGKQKIDVEFINTTHSTLQVAMIAIHTKQGVILYANDFKFDNSPILGKKPNYERLKEMGKEGILALIVDSLYAGDERKTPSEKIARGLLEDVLLTTSNENGCIIVTTFSSHIARLQSIVDFGKQLKRKVVFLGRSLNKYVSAARGLGLAPFTKNIQLVSYRRQLDRVLRKIASKRKEYLMVVTGHQGEPGSMLDRMASNKLPYTFSTKDHVIFSSKTIPTPVNITQKAKLDAKLKSKGVRIFSDIHVSGHAGREDLRDFIEMVQPMHLIPAHGDLKKLSALGELAQELGYKIGRDCHIMQDGEKVILSN